MTEKEAQVEKFHAWLALDPFRDGITIREIAIAERAWQASRKQALEEAAEAAEMEATGDPRDAYYDSACRMCAAAIRSLSQPTGGKE